MGERAEQPKDSQPATGRGITADTALRLARYFGTSPDVWMNLQVRYELDKARLSIGAAIARLPRFAAASKKEIPTLFQSRFKGIMDANSIMSGRRACGCAI